MIFQSLEIGVCFEPVILVLFEIGKATVGADFIRSMSAGFVDRIEDGPFRVVESPVVDKRLWERRELIENLIVDQIASVQGSEGNEVRISSVGGKGLIGGVAVASWS